MVIFFPFVDQSTPNEDCRCRNVFLRIVFKISCCILGIFSNNLQSFQKSAEIFMFLGCQIFRVTSEHVAEFGDYQLRDV